ncbi:MAG: hypothetical protein Q4A74_08655 [Cardiobacteriaceae bacterium]|nr:hypothetical protein [Cardiobacteriaceae bacterium]
MNQVIVTTHSPEFIDFYRLKNVILLDQVIGTKKNYKRTNQDISAINTIQIDISVEEGCKKIQEYLGLEEDKTDLLDSYNIFVEGECDKKYLEELSNYFKIKPKKIHVIGGVSKYQRELEFYDSWYSQQKNPDIYHKKPKVTLLFDNDEAGRESYKLIKKKEFKNLEVQLQFVPTRDGDFPDLDNLQKIKSNLEIEDFLYPELIYHLSDLILKSSALERFNLRELRSKLNNKGHRDKGILEIMNDLLRDKNPNGIGNINFCHTSIKGGLASKFTYIANKKISMILEGGDNQYPYVKRFISDIMKRD